MAVTRLLALPEAPAIIVVDNGSTDDTVATLRDLGAGVTVLELGHNAGAAGRNIGVAHARTPYVAFADDDSAWAPGALTHAARLLDQHPDLALVAARILVGDDATLDPMCAEMAASPLPAAPGSPGPSVLGFAACGAVVRRDAFLRVGGFDEHYASAGRSSPSRWR